MIEEIDVAVLGGGIAGLAYASCFESDKVIVFEAQDRSGGLLKSNTYEGFTYDTAVHLSFSKNESVRELFSSVGIILEHEPLSYNFYNGHWLKHPVVENISALSPQEKTDLVVSYMERGEYNSKPNTYYDYLISSYGYEFYQRFYLPYTRKYWCAEPEEMSTQWIGNRLANTDFRRILFGSYTQDTRLNYYADKMRYPSNGGYQQFLQCIPQRNVLCGKRVTHIDLNNKVISFADLSQYKYKQLASSIPLPEFYQLTTGKTCKLESTSMSLVNVAFNKPNIPKWLWYYIYDTDIMASRINSPSKKSAQNARIGGSSMQAEIYYRGIIEPDAELCIENTRYALKKMGICEDSDIIFMKHQYEPYANVLFTLETTTETERIYNELSKYDIDFIGRFGEWKYLWSDQSYLSGYEKGRARMETRLKTNGHI